LLCFPRALLFVMKEVRPLTKYVINCLYHLIIGELFPPEILIVFKIVVNILHIYCFFLQMYYLFLPKVAREKDGALTLFPHIKLSI